MTTDITVTKEGRHTTVSGLTYEEADAITDMKYIGNVYRAQGFGYYDSAEDFNGEVIFDANKQQYQQILRVVERMREAREKAAEQAEQAEQAESLPKLTGSPKQIAWAKDIRSGALESADEIVGALRRTLELDDEMPAEQVETAISIFKADLARTESSWWIDNDALFPMTLAAEERKIANADDMDQMKSHLAGDRKRRIEYSRSHYIIAAATMLRRKGRGF